MANYLCTIRTNYFHVKDNESFEEFMTHVYAEDLNIFTGTDSKGNKTYGFGGYGYINGYFDNEEDADEAWDHAYDRFIEGLQKHVAEDDAILIFEAGNEKLRYVVGSVSVITSDGYKYKEITDIGLATAREMLGNSNYETQCEY